MERLVFLFHETVTRFPYIYIDISATVAEQLVEQLGHINLFPLPKPISLMMLLVLASWSLRIALFHNVSPHTQLTKRLQRVHTDAARALWYFTAANSSSWRIRDVLQLVLCVCTQGFKRLRQLPCSWQRTRFCVSAHVYVHMVRRYVNKTELVHRLDLDWCFSLTQNQYLGVHKSQQ